MSKWQPIESVPKDDTPVLMCNAKTGMCWVGWTDGEFWNVETTHSISENAAFPPTHWMPLPQLAARLSRSAAMNSFVMEIRKADEGGDRGAWIFNSCDRCDKSKPVLLRIGPDVKYECSPFRICYDCFQYASRLLEQATKQGEQPGEPQ